MVEVLHGPDRDTDPKSAKAEAIALALMGAGALAAETLAEAASWQRSERALMGRRAILDACEAGIEKISVEQVVSHGAAGSVSGRYWREGHARAFCHVIRFTSPAATQVAQLVSFDHAV